MLETTGDLVSCLSASTCGQELKPPSPRMIANPTSLSYGHPQHKHSAASTRFEETQRPLYLHFFFPNESHTCFNSCNFTIKLNVKGKFEKDWQRTACFKTSMEIDRTSTKSQLFNQVSGVMSGVQRVECHATSGHDEKKKKCVFPDWLVSSFLEFVGSR